MSEWCSCNKLKEAEEKAAKYDAIVRCGECIHFRDIAWYDGSVKHRCSGVFTFIEPDPEGFCAWGRKEA